MLGQAVRLLTFLSAHTGMQTRFGHAPLTSARATATSDVYRYWQWAASKTDGFFAAATGSVSSFGAVPGPNLTTLLAAIRWFSNIPPCGSAGTLSSLDAVFRSRVPQHYGHNPSIMLTCLFSNNVREATTGTI